MELPCNETPTHPRRSLVIFRGDFIALFILLLLGYGGYRVIDGLYELAPELYSQEWVAGMVIRYMESNEGRWPQNWDDLQKPYEVAVSQGGQPWSFEDLRRRVEVDFSANPAELSGTPLTNEGEAGFRVIRLRSGRRHHWEGGEPNLRIWKYLQEHSPRSID